MPIFNPIRTSTAGSIGSILALLWMHPVSGQVIINEFLFRDPDTRLEYAEILNRSTEPIDLRRISISDERRSPVPITGRNALLPSGGYTVLVRDSVAFDARFVSARLQVPAWPALNNDGDELVLWIDGSAVDSVMFDNDWGSYGQSVERIDPRAPSSSASNWSGSLDPSGGTPGEQNSVFQPDRTGPRLWEAEEWFDGTVILYASEPLDPAVLATARIRFASGDRPLASHLSADGTRIILEPWAGADVTAVTVEGLRDAAGNESETESIAVAGQAREGDVIVNEILFEPNADAFDGLPDQREFVEVRSLADRPIAVRGMYMTGFPTETGSGDTLRSDNIPRRLRPRGYGFFYAGGAGTSSFTDAFPSTPADSIAFSAPIRRQTLLLDNYGDRVKLHTPDGVLLDDVTYSVGWHLPDRPVTRGLSLERISSSGLANDPNNWTSSVSSEGGTPGRDNSVALGDDQTGSSPLTVHPSPFSPDGDGREDFARIDIRTGRAATSVAVWIFDPAGRLVRALEETLPIGPEASFVWDGRDDADHSLPPGVFIVYVEAVDAAAGDVLRFKLPVVIARSR